MYPASLVPESIRPYYYLNPMAVIIESYRSAMLRDQMPNLPSLACAAAFALLVLASGYHVFKRLESRIVDVA